MFTRIGTSRAIGTIDVRTFSILILVPILTGYAVPAGDAKFYKSPFLRDFWHLNVAMMTSNNALVPDPDKEDILASKPFDWPFLHLGLRMCGWGDNQIKYYLMGTPVIWWGSSLSLIVAILSTGVYILRSQRKYIDMESREWEHFLYVSKIAFLGWALHYGASFTNLTDLTDTFRAVPFLIMGRVTYVHHYVRLSPFYKCRTPLIDGLLLQLPTLYFSVLMFGHLLDHFIFSSKRLTNQKKMIAFGVISSVIVLTFWWFRGVAFGIDGPIADHKGLQWRKVSDLSIGLSSSSNVLSRVGIYTIIRYLCDGHCLLYRYA